MKKIFLALVALCAILSMEAQTIEIYDNDGTTPVAVYNNDNEHHYKVVFKKIAVTGITLNKTETTIVIGGEETLTATVAPENAANKAVNWTSSNTEIATVDADGKVTGVAEGEAVITATAEDGSGVYAICTVTVTAPVTTGTAKRTGDIDVNWVQLWENGPKFAEYNVGASKAEDYGGYYCWGGTTNKSSSDSNKGTDVLTGDTDTATKLWGINWRMPTKDELTGLIDATKCTATWVTNYNGSNIGLLVTGLSGTAYENNSIFLPAAGFCDSDGVQGNSCSYWSSTPYDSNAYYLNFNSNTQELNLSFRTYGFSVRAVLAK